MDLPTATTSCCCTNPADIEAARQELTARGVPVGSVRHKSPIGDWKGGWTADRTQGPGIDGATQE